MYKHNNYTAKKKNVMIQNNFMVLSDKVGTHLDRSYRK